LSNLDTGKEVFKKYSKEYRGDVLAMRNAGAGTCEVAAAFNVPVSRICRIEQ